MSEIVYIFGAGVNKNLNDLDDGISPPLIMDFFQQALKFKKFQDPYYRNRLEPIFSYINKYWKLDPKKLEKEPFDLESLYTLIQLQFHEAQMNHDDNTMTYLIDINYNLTAFWAEFLAEFEILLTNSKTFNLLGKNIYKSKPTIITFNYDTLLETVIEQASGINLNYTSSLQKDNKLKTKKNDFKYSYYNWNRQLSYGIKFDELVLNRPGLTKLCSGKDLYSHNKLYNPPLLKLHGSINWFIYSGINQFNLNKENVKKKKGKTLLLENRWWIYEVSPLDGHIIIPIIITPVLNKKINKNKIIYSLWQRAKTELSTCKKLIVCGYSFPPTDFHTRRLFMEAFSEHKLEEIIIVNPNLKMVPLLKELCQFDKPILVCKDLNEFLTIIID